MADVVVKLRVMPKNPDIDLEIIEEETRKKIEGFGGQVHKVEREPIAFGLVALDIIFISDEKKGDTENLEREIETISGVQSVEVTDVRRAFG